MLRGMHVKLRDLRNFSALNGCSGYVTCVQSDKRMCVRLEGDPPKNVVVKAENIEQYVRAADNIASDTLTCEFMLGTPEDEVFATVKNMYGTLDMKEELQILFRPQGAVTARSMSQENINLLVQSARLEYMGALSETAQLLGWVVCGPDIHGRFVYMNHTLHKAMQTTAGIYTLHTEMRQDAKAER